MHTYFPQESFTFLLEQARKYSGAQILPALRGLEKPYGLNAFSAHPGPDPARVRGLYSTPAFLGAGKGQRWVGFRVHSNIFFIVGLQWVLESSSPEEPCYSLSHLT